MPGGGTRLPASADVIAQKLNTFTMDGPKVWDFAVDTVPRTVRALLEEHHLEPGDLDLVILHQSNLRMLEAIMKALEMPMEKTVTTVESYGNTAVASIPLTLNKAAEDGRLKAGARVMMCGFGGGLSWGAGLLDLVSQMSSGAGAGGGILITGAASGIGAGLAAELASTGHHVIVSDVRLADATPVAAHIRDRGGSAEAVALDVTSDDSVAAAVAGLSRPVDVLVNNAGLQHVAPLEAFPIAKWDFLIQVMLDGRGPPDARGAARHARRAGSAASSTWGASTRWWRAPTRAPTSPPSTGWSASPGRSRWRPPTSTSPSTPSARAT